MWRNLWIKSKYRPRQNYGNRYVMFQIIFAGSEMFYCFRIKIYLRFLYILNILNEFMSLDGNFSELTITAVYSVYAQFFFEKVTCKHTKSRIRCGWLCSWTLSRKTAYVVIYIVSSLTTTMAPYSHCSLAYLIVFRHTIYYDFILPF